ncbi:sigma-E factor regulatory protein RseB domain-containing protein [Prauserella halophila]|uniref:Sigma-E factor regulatory protein RseB domain-containing protein n=1 Tax=Prauserella halophila TaxID=185641 RepID=A0ABP4GQZ2_9PSEU|nr:sigma-E factor regulatory protein RseB domain-containing protein [Prauserella halophila]MCP2236035.1 Outer membrane lipoprotein-sorting protein [Prauserella halophila]
MNTKRKAATVAVAGTAAGALGLGLLAMPAGAESAPELPEIEAQELVGSVLKAQPPAMSGTATVDNELGLPSVPGMPALDAQSARVYYDGEGRGRVAMEQQSSELTYVLGEREFWSYDSAAGTATRAELPDGAREQHRNQEAAGADPSQVATQVVDRLEESSNVSVDGTARVAGRAAYELVLTPKPDERTLVREVRVAVDSEERLPLRMSVLTHGTTEPAFEAGFSEIEFGPQPERLFEFSPPEGTEVTEREPGRNGGPQHGGDAEGPEFDVAGDGWDTVLLGRIPSEMREGAESNGTDMTGMLERFGKPVQGEFGSGHVVETRIGTALITEDGRIAAGAVPEQVLRQALENR